jgi:hypothetical protein
VLSRTGLARLGDTRCAAAHLHILWISLAKSYKLVQLGNCWVKDTRWPASEIWCDPEIKGKCNGPGTSQAHFSYIPEFYYLLLSMVGQVQSLGVTNGGRTSIKPGRLFPTAAQAWTCRWCRSRGIAKGFSNGADEGTMYCEWSWPAKEETKTFTGDGGKCGCPQEIMQQNRPIQISLPTIIIPTPRKYRRLRRWNG